MNFQKEDTARPASALRRFDLYRNIHKALRNCMGNTLLRVSALDGTDQAEIIAVLNQVRELLQFCRIHLQHENHFIHAALEARRPGAAQETTEDHQQHLRACDHLEGLADQVARTEGLARLDAITQLYRHIALFIADNLAHMEVEETEVSAALWDTHSDYELMTIQNGIVGALAPEQKAMSLRWMLPALNPQERYELLRGMRMGMPANAFAGLLLAAEQILEPGDWRKLCGALSAAEQKVA